MVLINYKFGQNFQHELIRLKENNIYNSSKLFGGRKPHHISQ